MKLNGHAGDLHPDLRCVSDDEICQISPDGRHTEHHGLTLLSTTIPFALFRPHSTGTTGSGQAAKHATVLAAAHLQLVALQAVARGQQHRTLEGRHRRDRAPELPGCMIAGSQQSSGTRVEPCS